MVDGEAAGAWIAPRLGEELTSFADWIPGGYEAYVRILHEVCDVDDNPVTWGEVATALGTVAHAEMEWHTVVGTEDYFNLKGSKWSGSNPFQGELDVPALDVLCELLIAHSHDPDHAFFGLSTITGWDEDFSPEELQGHQLLGLPGREYIVLAGRLADVDQIARDNSRPSSSRSVWVWTTRPEDRDAALQKFRASRDREAPNLIWPQDRSWFMFTEVDFDSTIVGGSADLVADILAAPSLDAWQLR